MTESEKPDWKARIASSAKATHERLSEAKARSDATAKFAGVTLAHDGRIGSKQGGRPVAGAHASVETLGQIRGRRTVKTLGLHQKKIDERESILTIKGTAWEISVPVDPKDGGEARAFAAKVNTAAPTAGQAPQT